MTITLQDQLMSTGRRVRRFVVSLTLWLIAATPIIAIENKDTPEFWYCTGAWGLFLVGLNHLFR